MSLARALARLDRVSLEVLVESAEVCARGALLRASLALEMRARARRVWGFCSPSDGWCPTLEFLVERALGYHRAADKLRSVQVAARDELVSRRSAKRPAPCGSLDCSCGDLEAPAPKKRNGVRS